MTEPRSRITSQASILKFPFQSLSLCAWIGAHGWRIEPVKCHEQTQTHRVAPELVAIPVRHLKRNLNHSASHTNLYKCGNWSSSTSRPGQNVDNLSDTTSPSDYELIPLSSQFENSFPATTKNSCLPIYFCIYLSIFSLSVVFASKHIAACLFASSRSIRQKTWPDQWLISNPKMNVSSENERLMNL